MRGFHSITLGCKLNQFDSAAIEGELARRGFRPESDPARAAVVVVNTCTVTGKADAEARRIIRGVRRRNPDCRLLVTGCYAELDSPALAAIPGIDRVFGNLDKARVAEILDEIGLVADGENGEPGALHTLLPGGVHATTEDAASEERLDLPGTVHLGDRARAFLKVQEGCDLACSYCIIPRVRGRSRSVPPPVVESALRSLVDSGYREIVLTGVNTGDYGKDLEGGGNLATLLDRIVDPAGGYRVRINSLEPRTVTGGIVERFASGKGLAPHLQVPLQSGSDAVLRRMRRNYRTSTYMDRIESLRRAVPDMGLGADVIVGFPGETAERFEETYRFIEESPLNYLHVFSFSPRPGTPASEMDGRVEGGEIRERSRRLRSLAERLGYHFRRRFTGRVLEAVVIGEVKDGSGIRALTGNYIEVILPADSPVRRREMIPVRITEVKQDVTLGVALAR